jgi:hypothetical protein
VHNLLVQHGIIKADKVTSWKPKKKTAEAGAAKPIEKPAPAHQSAA